MTAIENTTAKGQLLALPFAQTDVAASQAAVELGLTDGVAARYVAPFDGEIVGISARASAARTAGILRARTAVNGVADGPQAELNATPTQAQAVQWARGQTRFGAGDSISVLLTTTAAWTPVTADLLVTVFVLVYIEGV